ncbi:MAG: alpha/beta hydrolase [Candidatus Saccharimonadales bacterium]
MKSERSINQASQSTVDPIEQMFQEIEQETDVLTCNGEDITARNTPSRLPSEKKHRLLGRKAFVSLSATLALAAHEGLGITETYDKWSGKPSAVLEIADAADPLNNDILFNGAVGFGNMDASNMMTALRPLRQQGRLLADRESDKGINTDEQAEKLIEYAQQHDVREIVLIGHSIGGLKMLNKAARAKEIIADKKLDITLQRIVLLQTPYSIDSVRTNMRSFGQKVCNYAEYAPWLKYYWFSRYLPEMMARKDRYIDVNNHAVDVGRFVETSSEVYKEKIRDPSATANVLYDQFCVQLGATAKGAINRLRKFGDVEISYFRPEDASSDTVVDEDDAVVRFRNSTNHPDIRFTVHNLPNIGHSSPGQAPRSFNRLFEQTVISDIAARRRHQKLVQQCIQTAFTPGPTTMSDCVVLAQRDDR